MDSLNMIMNRRATPTISSNTTNRKNPRCNNALFDGAIFTLLTTIKITGNKAAIVVAIILARLSSK